MSTWFPARKFSLPASLAMGVIWATMPHASGQDLPATVAPLRGADQPSQFIPFSVPTSQMSGTDAGGAGTVVTLSASLDKSLTEGPRMAGVRALLGVAKAGYAQASVLPNPGLYIANNYGNSYLTGASIPIEPPWKLVFRLLIAKRQVEQTQLEISRTLWQFRGEVRRTYVAYVTAEELRKAREQVRDLSEKIVSASMTQFDKGAVPGLDVHRAKLALIQAKMDAEQAAIQVAQAKEQLNFIMGKKPETPVTTPPLQLGKEHSELLPDFSRELISRDKLEQIAHDNRLELKIAKAVLRTNQANLKNAYGNAVPTPRFVTGRVVESNPPSGPKTRNGFFQAYIDAPLFNVNQGDIARFKALEKQLKLDLAAQENQVAGQVSLAYHKVLAARQRLRTFTEEALPEAINVGNISKHGYELGQLDLNTVLDAQRATVTTQTQFYEAVLNYQLALNDLEQATGAPLPP